MRESRMIQVRKRSGQAEKFDVAKLAGCIWRAIDIVGGDYCEAYDLARAVEIFLARKGRESISSSAILEMALKALRRVRLGDAAEVLELHHALRSIRRRMLRVNHGSGQITEWNKNWLVNLSKQVWHLSDSTARIIAGEIELEVLPCQEERIIGRADIYSLLNEKVMHFGLVDALPVAKYSIEQLNN